MPPVELNTAVRWCSYWCVQPRPCSETRVITNPSLPQRHLPNKLLIVSKPVHGHICCCCCCCCCRHCCSVCMLWVLYAVVLMPVSLSTNTHTPVMAKLWCDSRAKVTSSKQILYSHRNNAQPTVTWECNDVSERCRRCLWRDSSRLWPTAADVSRSQDVIKRGLRVLIQA